jgi:hypothetical protein
MNVHFPHSLRSMLLAAVAALALALAPATSRAEDLGNEAGLGAAAALGSLLYAPVKLIYAMGGGLTAGLAWVFSAGDSDVVNPIIDASLRGDYVITPDHLRGERPVEFIGRSPAQNTARQDEPPASDETF